MPKQQRKHEARPSRHTRRENERERYARAGDAQPLREFDRLIHERVRLGMVSALAVNESLTFSDLKGLLATTDGNLSVHARKLEEAGYVACDKYFDGRVPRTEYRLTAEGRKALEQYLDEMEDLISSMRKR
ncbi:MAG: transcriptional regulator [Acidobacteria bacterium]|nr:transcriptional regulator [Acidobacteriota bacterium]